MGKPLLVIGAGGHAKVVLDALLKSGAEVAGLVDADPATHGRKVLEVPVLGGDEIVSRFRPDGVLLVNGVGSVGLPALRGELFSRFKGKGYSFATVIHPSAVIGSDVALGEGAQVMAGAVLQPGCRIGANAIVNTRASVDHDSQIGDGTHLAPGVTLSGFVRIGGGTHVGAGAVVIQGIAVGSGAVVAAGAVVVRDVQDGATVMGIPAGERQR